MDPFRQNCSASARVAGYSSRIGETVRMLLGVTLLQREVLEAKAGGASTVTGGGRRLHYLDSAQRAIQSGGASRKPTGNERECAAELRLRKAMWPRETTARSGDIVARCGHQRQSQWLRVLQRSTVVCGAARNTKCLAARVGGCGPSNQAIRDANAMYGMDGMPIYAVPSPFIPKQIAPN